jgi:Dyp-type peroxidase family
MSDNEPILATSEIQGNGLRGFASPHQQLLGLKFDAAHVAKEWTKALAPRIRSLEQVHTYRLARSVGALTNQSAVLMNVAFSREGLRLLGVDASLVADGFFQQPMGVLAGSLGDKMVGGKPVDYVVGTSWEDTPDLLVVFGADDQHALCDAAESFRADAESVGVRLIYKDEGAILPGGTEHFGFRDGISQPGPRGRLSADPRDTLTLRYIDPADPRAEAFARPGQALVWPGQFVFGYPTQLPGSRAPGPLADGGAPWMTNGSLLVLRRLRQNVLAFRRFCARAAEQATGATGRIYSSAQIAAMLVGRWEDGTPATLRPEGPDPLVSGNDFWINHFAYGNGVDAIGVGAGTATELIEGSAEDRSGQRCPYFAHVRKVNPRDVDTDQGVAGRTLTFQMLRRGIPYGPPLQGTNDDGADRGLLFLAYMTSVERQFQTINRLWMNNPSAPEVGEAGHDMLVGQAMSGGSRFMTLRDSGGVVRVRVTADEQWVTPTGGAFLFVPSVSFLRELA